MDIKNTATDLFKSATHIQDELFDILKRYIPKQDIGESQMSFNALKLDAKTILEAKAINFDLQYVLRYTQQGMNAKGEQLGELNELNVTNAAEKLPIIQDRFLKFKNSIKVPLIIGFTILAAAGAYCANRKNTPTQTV